MRIAYADPPYEGMAKMHYGKNGDRFAGAVQEVDHPALIARLCTEFPDGWALSCKSNSLRNLLPICPDDVRVLAWVKKFAVIKKHVSPTYAWEPVIMRGGRRGQKVSARKGYLKDWQLTDPAIRADRFVGSKPLLFCHWVFGCLGLEPDDELVDLFPGTGAVADAWAMYRGQQSLDLEVA